MSREKRNYDYTPEQLKRMEMRKKRVALRRKKERQRRMLFAIGILIFALLCIGGISALRKSDDKTEETGHTNATTVIDANDPNIGNVTETGELPDTAQLNQTADGVEPSINETISTVNSETYQFKADTAIGLNNPEVTSKYALMVIYPIKRLLHRKMHMSVLIRLL